MDLIHRLVYFVWYYMGGTIEMKGITKWNLTTISESAVHKKFLGQIVSSLTSLQISNSLSLECYVVI
jgi:hypothetical protein